MRTQQLIQEALAWNQAIEQKVRANPFSVDEALTWLKSAIEVVKATPVTKGACYRTRREEAAALLQQMQVYVPAYRHLLNLQHQLKAKVPLTSLDLFCAHFFRNALQMDNGFSGFNPSRPLKVDGSCSTHRTFLHAKTAWTMAENLNLLQPDAPLVMLTELQACPESFRGSRSTGHFINFSHLRSSARYQDLEDEKKQLSRRKTALLLYILNRVELSCEQKTLLTQALL